MEPETHDVRRDFVREARTREYFFEHHPVSRHIEEDLRDARELPRFPPGTRVECKYDGKFLKGTVVGNHYREPHFEPGYWAPYQIQLDDDEPGDMIYINYDRDESIRAA